MLNYLRTGTNPGTQMEVFYNLKVWPCMSCYEYINNHEKGYLCSDAIWMPLVYDQIARTKEEKDLDESIKLFSLY